MSPWEGVTPSTEPSPGNAARLTEPSGPLVEVALPVPLRSPLVYLGAEGTAEAPPLGCRVRVPLGSRSAVGFVVGHPASVTVPPQALRRVQQVIDSSPLLDLPLQRLLRWTADYYHHPLGEVLAGALPRALREGAPAAEPPVALWRATPEGRAALGEATPRRAPAQRALLERLASSSGGMSAAALAAELPGWSRCAQRLRARGWIECVEQQTSPEPALDPAALAASSSSASSPGSNPTLSEAQSTAVNRIDSAADRFAAFVLQGATGSGKTEVYLQCAARTLARGRAALILVPEIALTPQLVERFRTRLAVPTSVLHSALSDTERLGAWRAAASGAAPLVLGTRSAVFAAMPQLGLIIIDEEHDGSYKQQEGGCRYGARDVAVVRAQQCAIPIVLGSATPAFETLNNIATARYERLELPRRADQAPAPTLKLVDLRAHAVHRGIAAPVLEAMRRQLAAGAQVLVYINRRGYAPTLLCTSCGWIAPCSDCDARLTVHRTSAELACHHCGARQPLPPHCLRCGHAVKPVGQGTERVEETLQELFADAGLLRLDRDTAARPQALERIVQQLRAGQARILVGTQMVTKGHHFPGMRLAVVLNADQGLFSTDFRAAERLAQTLVQVAGRAGREQEQGEVLIQTEFPEHPLLQSLLAGGYEAFAAAGLDERRTARWPPFARLALLRASTRAPEAVLQFLSAARAAAATAHAAASTGAEVRLLGPVPAAMARRAGRHYAQLLLECAGRAPLHRFLTAWLPAVDALARQQHVRYGLDVDPLEIG